MKRTGKTYTALPAALLLTMIIMLPAPHFAFAQLPAPYSTPAQLPASQDTPSLPETPLFPSEMLLQESSRTALFGWGNTENENSLEGSEGDENSNAFNDAPVAGGMYLLIVLVILYGLVARFRTRMTRRTRMNADRHCEPLAAKQSRIFGERASGTDALSRRDNMLVERKNIHTIFPTVPSGTECAGGDNVRFSYSHSVPYGTVKTPANDIFYQHSVPDGTALYCLNRDFHD